MVVGLGVSRRSSCSSGCCWGRTVQHTSGLNHHHSPPARPQSTVRPAPVRGGRPRRGTVPRRVCGACSCVRGKASSADAPVLLTDEKVLGVVAGLVVSRRSSSRSGCCWGRIVEHISGLNYCCGLPSWSESLVWPAPVRGKGRRWHWWWGTPGLACSCVRGKASSAESSSSSLRRRPCQVVARPGVSRRSSCRRGAQRPGLIALACARAGLREPRSGPGPGDRSNAADCGQRYQWRSGRPAAAAPGHPWLPGQPYGPSSPQTPRPATGR